MGALAAGDRLAVRGCSGLRRGRVFPSRCKPFEEPLSAAASARLAGQGAGRRVLLVPTGGKPGDLGHHEGVRGIEASGMAMHEARALGQAVHGVAIEAEPKDWLPRIFGKGGFTPLPDRAPLPRALPDLYHALTRET